MRIGVHINGSRVTLEVAAHERLLDALRAAGHVSVKHGCETGECGACAVLIDGVPRPTCVMLAAQAMGRTITTIEGLTPWHQREHEQELAPPPGREAGGMRPLHPLQQVFADSGAVQCGYCIPAMILTALALLEQNPDPTEAEVRDAISGNLCRCTGYVKPVQAILRAAAIMHGAIPPTPFPEQEERTPRNDIWTPGGAAREADRLPQPSSVLGQEPLRGEEPGVAAVATLPRVGEELRIVGKPARKVDAIKLVTGKPCFVADIELRGMLHAQILTSPHAHARIKRIDTSRARALAGVHAVLTYQDVPRVPYTTAGQSWPEPGPHDQYSLDNTVRFVGDRVAVVAAETPEIARRAIDLIEVEYEVLPAVLDMRDAMKPDAPCIHPEPESYHIYDAARNIAAHIEAEVGNIEQGFATADLVVEGEYCVPQVQQTPLENHVVITYWDEDDRLVVRSSTQVPYHVRRIIAPVIGLPPRRIRVIKPRIGGGFGVKQEVLIEDLAAHLTIATGRPVKLEYTREEEFRSSRSRHPQILYMKTGVKWDGTIVANEMRVLANTGAYGTHALTVQSNTGSKSLPIYRAANIHFVADVVYTNLPPPGAFRGYGAPQGFFALESHMDEVAKRLGMDPVEFRRKNWLRVGDPNPLAQALGEGREGFVQIVQSCGLEECVRIGQEAIGWTSLRDPLAQKEGGSKTRRRGVGMAIAMHGTAIPGLDMGAASIKLNDDGSFNVLVGATDLGTGSDTVLAQIAAEVLGCAIDDIIIYSSDTDFTPFDTGAYASSTTYISGGALKKAAEEVRAQMIEVAARMLNATPDSLRCADRRITASDGRSVTLAEVALHSLHVENQRQIMATASRMSYDSPPPFAAQFAEVEVDMETGQVRVLKAVSAVDCGRAINPATAAGQIEGGTTQALGYGTCEEMAYDEHGALLTTDLRRYHIYTAADMPVMQTFLVETSDPYGPFGAKAVAEIPLDGMAPAIANAVANAIGVRVRAIPLTPERVLRAIKAL
jgi:putative selenate reductase molybdopterin-binding subunit